MASTRSLLEKIPILKTSKKRKTPEKPDTSFLMQLTNNDRSQLKSYVGQKGTDIETIVEFNELDTLTKLRLVKTAMDVESIEFNKILVSLEIKRNNDNNPFIQSLKRINNFCLNNNVIYEYSSEAGKKEKRALTHYFGLGEEISQELENKFKGATRELINSFIQKAINKYNKEEKDSTQHIKEENITPLEFYLPPLTKEQEQAIESRNSIHELWS